ncbi:MAG: YihY/virulence factor BrkB family protein [Flavobacteriales bacterium]|nr:YihY/virulence factor BrkB family protein [Flavobacteriales bacterium]
MFKPLIEYIQTSPPVEWTRSALEKIILPGFEGLNLLFVIRFFFHGLGNGALALRASAISFQLIMAFFPTVILLFSLIPYISDDFQILLLNYLSDIIPNRAYAVFEGAIVDLIQNKRTGILSVTFLLVFYYSSRSVSSILSAFGQSVNLVNRQGAFIQFFISLLIMLVLAILVITALSLVTASGWVADYLDSLEIIDDGIQTAFFYLTNYAIVLLLFMMAISILYNVGNPDDKGWKVFSAGTTLASLLMILIALGFATYVNDFTSFDELYGYVGSVIGSIIIFCLWIYFNSIVLLIGFELNASISRARKAHSEVKESLVEKHSKL